MVFSNTSAFTLPQYPLLIPRGELGRGSDSFLHYLFIDRFSRLRVTLLIVKRFSLPKGKRSRNPILLLLLLFPSWPYWPQKCVFIENNCVYAMLVPFVFGNDSDCIHDRCQDNCSHWGQSVLSALAHAYSYSRSARTRERGHYPVTGNSSLLAEPFPP